MYGFYTPVLLLQVFCVYHAYRNNAAQRWYWIVLLFPLVGSIIYLFYNLNNNRAAIHTFKDSMKQIMTTDYRIEELEKALEFSESVTNRVNLADAYMEVERYDDASTLYSACLQGFMSDDPLLRMKLLYARFMHEDYAEVIRLGVGLGSDKEFRKSEQRLAYAWALYHKGDSAGAEAIFKDMDHSFTNYAHRLEYCKFLIKTEKTGQAKEKLSELLDEFAQMHETERGQRKPMQREITALFENLVRST